jgi:hypothetical protein
MRADGNADPVARTLEKRLELVERVAEPAAFDRRSWLWMVLLGVILPLVLILLGWRFVAVP